MAKNIEMQYYNGSSYEICYPKTIMTNVTGTLSIANGGTGGTSAAAARQNLSVYSKAEVDTLIGNSGSIPQISFEINGTTYSCASGTTWGAWETTSEGKNVIIIDRDDAVCDLDGNYLVDTTGVEQYIEDLIENDERYYSQGS